MKPFAPASSPPASATANEADLQKRITRLEQILHGLCSFGDPGQSASENMAGRWVEVTVTSANRGAQTTVTHNLNTPTVGASTPNVAWLVWRISGAVGATAAASAQVFYDGGTITTNSIQLRFCCSQAVDTTWLLWFVPASG